MTQITKQSRATPPEPAATPKAAGRRRSPLDRALDPAVFKALADPTRCRLFACLTKCARPCSVTELAACCSVDFSVVARHMSTLARAGLATAEKRGRVVWYAPAHHQIAAAFRELADTIEGCAPDSPCGDPPRCGCEPSSPSNQGRAR